MGWRGWDKEAQENWNMPPQQRASLTSNMKEVKTYIISEND